MILMPHFPAIVGKFPLSNKMSGGNDDNTIFSQSGSIYLSAIALFLFDNPS
jgi:hypothetical protein